jgi:hypothetical protein
VNHFLASDPDTILVRDLSLEAQRLNATAALMAGPIINFGDDVAALDEQRRSLLGALTPLVLRREERVAPSFLPLDLFENPNTFVDNKFAHILAPDDYYVPSLWFSPGTGEFAVFNWWSEAEILTVELPAPLGEEDTLQEHWTGETLPVVDGKVTLTLPAGSVRLLLAP